MKRGKKENTVEAPCICKSPDGMQTDMTQMNKILTRVEILYR